MMALVLPSNTDTRWNRRGFLAESSALAGPPARAIPSGSRPDPVRIPVYTAKLVSAMYVSAPVR